MSITESRVNGLISPAYLSVVNFLIDKKTETITAVDYEPMREFLKKKYGEFEPTDLWVEYIPFEKVLEDNSVLTCFTIKKNGFGFIDARLKPVSYIDLVKALDIPILYFKDNAQLVNQIKNNDINSLIYVTSEKRLGVTLDRSGERIQFETKLRAAIGNLNFNNIKVNYQTEYTPTLQKLTGGDISLVHPLVNPITLSIFDIVDIKNIK